MTGKELANRALTFASEKHADMANEKSYEPFIAHPVRVASNFKDNPKLQAIAYLHDVLEDTDATGSELIDVFGYDIANSVIALTRVDGENYFDYICRCKRDKNARVVKVYDLVDNMNLNRLPVITKRDAERQFKYAKALKILMEDE